MNDVETDPGGGANERKRSAPRRKPKGRSVSISKMESGRPTPYGTFPEAIIGSPLEQRLLPFLHERNFGAGTWKIDVRNGQGHFEQSFDFTIEDHPALESVIDADFEDVAQAQDEEDYYDYESIAQPQSAAGLTAAEIKLMLLEERERERERSRAAAQSQDASMLAMLQASWDRTFQMQQQQIELARAADRTPREDATSQALKMMEQAFTMVTKARVFADEMMPDSGGSEGGSILADGAKLIDSVGRAAGPFMPAIASILTQPAAPSPGGAPQAGGEFSNLGAAIRGNGNATAVKEKEAV